MSTFLPPLLSPGFWSFDDIYWQLRRCDVRGARAVVDWLKSARARLWSRRSRTDFDALSFQAMLRAERGRQL